MANITSWTDLAAISSGLSGDYVLTANLSSADSDYSSAGGDDWTPIGVGSGTEFTGTFDGGGYSISDLVINFGAIYCGLFGRCSAVTITDLALIDVDITNTGANTGALIGQSADASTITNCSSTGTITGEGECGGLIGYLHNAAAVLSKSWSSVTIVGNHRGGGLVGQASGSPVIDDCYSTGSVTTATGGQSGGFVGFHTAITTNCYSTGAVIGTTNIGGFCGYLYNGTAINCYATGDVTGVSSSNDVGPFVGLDSSTAITNCWYAADSTILNNGSGSPNTTGTSTTNAVDFYDKTLNVYDPGTNDWDFTTPIWYENTSTYPTLVSSVITSWTDLAAISSSLAGNYRLVTNLSSADSDYASAGGNAWTPLGPSGTPFTGTFDGNNFTISNLTISTLTGDNQGLFGVISGATLSNLGLLDVDIAADNYVGALFGAQAGASTITNCYSTGVIDGDVSTGGLFGSSSYYDITINNCWSSVTITGLQGSGFGHLACDSAGVVNNCYATGNVTVTGAAGGFAHDAAYVTITNCYATGTVSSGSYAGGFANGTVGGLVLKNCYATGDVTGVNNDFDYVGPLIGALSGSQTNCWYAAEATITNNGTQGENTTGTSTTNRSDFYDKTLNVYDNGTPVWDFTTPVWYELPTTYPLLLSSFTSITSWTDLAAMSSDLAGNYMLGASLDSGDSDYSSAGGDSWTPIGSTGTPFTGTLNGNGQTISDLTMSGTTYQGLFGAGVGAAFTNVQFLDVDVTASGQWSGALAGNLTVGCEVIGCSSTGTIDGTGVCGGLIGYIHTGWVEECWSSATVTSSGNSNGGLIGWTNNGSHGGSSYEGALNCYATGDVTVTGVTENTGGFAGRGAWSAMTNCYASGTVTGAANVGGFVGNIASKNIINCYATGDVTGDVDTWDTVGPLTGTGTSITNSWYAADATVVNNGTGGNINSDGTETTNKSDFYVVTQNVYDNGSPVWDFSTPVWYARAAGYPKLEAVVSIGSWTDLAAIASDLAGDYALTADLDSSDGDYSSAGGDDWTGIGQGATPFTGTFDGDGYTISDLIEDDAAYGCLFGVTEGSTISNLGVIDVDATSTNSYTGGIVGWHKVSSVMTNCYATGTVDGVYNIGVLVGENNASTIDKCYSSGAAIGSNNKTGGLVGNHTGATAAITNCYSSATADGLQCGGLVGQIWNNPVITNCYATGDVTGSTYAGGLVGNCTSGYTVKNSYATGTVAGTGTLAGLIGNDGDGTPTTDFVNCWWYSSMTKGIGNRTPDESTGYWEKATAASDFYVVTQDVYDAGSPVWDFSTPIWYAYPATYPIFDAPPPVSKAMQAILF